MSTRTESRSLKMDLAKWLNCFILVFLFQRIPVTTCVDTNALRFTLGIFPEESFLVQTLPTLHQCVVNCLHFNLCKSATFDKRTGRCHLHQHRANTNIYMDGSVMEHTHYVDSTDIPKFLSGACAGHNCSIYDRCMPISETEYTCLPFFRSEWACHNWTAAELNDLAVEVQSLSVMIEYCEAVEYRVYNVDISLNPQGCGVCHCCKLVFVLN